MKTIKYLILFEAMLWTIFPSLSFSQHTFIPGKYSFSDGNFNESLALKPNGEFLYSYSAHFLRIEIFGNWQVRENQIVLDSSPQRDKIICFESRNSKAGKLKFFIKNKLDDRVITYHLYAITSNSDTIKLRDQFGASEIEKHDVVSFYLENTWGIRTPVYLIQGRKSNVFRIWMEQRRVFENEGWDMKNNGIIPKNFAGNSVGYLLKKE